MGEFNSDITSPNSTASSFMYDEESRLKKSYVAITDAFYITYRQYDELNRISRLSIENKVGTLVYDYSFVYDANGNRIEDIDNLTDKRIVYAYDNINQLLEENYYTGAALTRKYTYTYDKLGNRLTKTPLSGVTTAYGYNDFNEILNAGSFPYTHDNNGNIIKAGTFDFVYNDEHQLIEFKSSGALVASYEYDWRGLRNKKVTSSKTELYYYTGNDLTYITDGTNNLKYYFVRDLNGRLQHIMQCTPDVRQYDILIIAGSILSSFLGSVQPVPLSCITRSGR